MLQLAWAGLRRHRLRTSLTVVSLIVGVAAVIAIVALGARARTAIERQVASAGTRLVIVSAGNWTAGGVRLGMGSSSRLIAADVAGGPRRASRHRGHQSARAVTAAAD